MTLLLTGLWPLALLIAAALTAVVSAYLLHLFRSRTLRSMQEEAQSVAGTLGTVTPGVARTIPPGPVPGTGPGPRETIRCLRSMAWVYAAGGVMFAMVLAVPWMIAADDSFKPGRFLWLLGCYSWPVIISTRIVMPAGIFGKLMLALIYFTCLAIIGAYSLARSPELTIAELMVFWVISNAPGSLLLWAFLARPVRAVGPLVLAFMVAAVTGALLANQALFSGAGALGTTAERIALDGAWAIALVVLLYLAGFALFGIVGWRLLRMFGRWYQAKSFSDQSMLLDSQWLVFAFVQPILLVFQGWAWIITGPVAFAVYKLTTRLGLAYLARTRPRPAPAARLLLLRVFSLGRRSERFFDVFSKYWRVTGSISMIAGPDLVTTVVKPHEFLEFVSGRLSRQFVRDREDLEHRLAQFDDQPDPDGRYRINEYFCHVNTWKMTMERLAVQSSAVLMDLRSFSPENQGCLFELQTLIDSVALRRIVLLVDKTTDREFLDVTLLAALGQMAEGSPNQSAVIEDIRVYPVTGHSRKIFTELQAALLS